MTAAPAASAARGSRSPVTADSSDRLPFTGTSSPEPRLPGRFLALRGSSSKDTKKKLDSLSGHLDNQTLALDELLEAVMSAKDMLIAGQMEILEAVSGGNGTCDLTELEEGQAHIKSSLGELGTEAEKLDDILKAVESAEAAILDGQDEITKDIADLNSNLESAKTEILDGQMDISDGLDTLSDELATTKSMILDGQGMISSSIDTLSSDLSTTKSMILDAIGDLDDDIADVSSQIDVAKTMILDGQTALGSDISDLSTQLTNVETSILAELSDVDTKLDELQTGQEEICDKIEALDAKLDTIISKLMGSCADGSMPVNGQCFALFEDSSNFEDAQAACEAQGGTLATMTADNAAALYALADMASNDKVWIGLTAESGTAWEWVDGTDYPSGFMDWDGGTEPSPASMRCGEAEATSSSDGNWNDISCTAQRQFICSSAPA
ncbi:C-type lectin domain family 4 member M [Amphibalanus amphitrite]|uniref:C-type lectin domain family 4 member M n=1 Tax=Amphibalanus amphitrite TaxID=1232801 RepID=A0A6A4WJL7_AMPAM|nr:C-type lectin domain family 4 member M [Amphibalanus amphitrite]